MVEMGDTVKMIAVGLVWGATNALMRRGAVLWDRARQRSSRRGLLGGAAEWARLLLIWQYTVPFAVNLSASAAFFAALARAPISVAVPVTNATAVFGALLGEEIRVRSAALGAALTLLGVWLCVSQPSKI